MSLSSIPSSFLAGLRDRLTTNTLQLLWDNRSTAEKEQITKRASIGAPPANFLPNPSLTVGARQAAWENLTDAARATYTADARTATNNLIGNLPAKSESVRKTGFAMLKPVASDAAAPATALELGGGYLAGASQAATSDTITAFRSIWKQNFATTALVNDRTVTGKDTDGLILVSARTGTTRPVNPYTDDPARSDDAYDLFETQLTTQTDEIKARFGSGQAVLGYDANGNGYIDNENELFGTAGGLSIKDANLVPSRLMVLRSDGTSVAVTQSSFATSVSAVGGYNPYTTVQSFLRRDDSGRYEIVVDAQKGIVNPPATLPDATPAALPRIARIEATAGNVVTGGALEIAVRFDQDVVLTGTATLKVKVGSTLVDATATAADVTGGVVRFRYTVAAGDSAPDGVSVPAGSITLGAGATLTEAAAGGRAADLTVAAASLSTTTVNRTAPSVAADATGTRTAVLVNPKSAYARGDAIEYTLTFDNDVVVTGKPTIALRLVNPAGTGDRNVTMEAVATQGRTITFRYVVQAGDDASGFSVVANSLALPAGAGIADKYGNAATTTFAASATTTATVDTTAPVFTTAQVVGGSATSPVGSDGNVTIDVAIDGAVVANGGITSPTLTFTIDDAKTQARTAQATGLVTGADGKTYLRFVYTPKAGDTFQSLSVTSDQLDLVNAVVTDAAGNLLASGPKRTLLETGPFTPPRPVSFSAPAGNLKNGQVLEIAVTFNRDIEIPTTEKPRLTVGVGTATRTATFNRIVGNVAYFRYTVVGADDAQNGIKIPVDALSLNGATILDKSGQTATLGNSAVTLANTIVDQKGPVVPIVNATTGARASPTLVNPKSVYAAGDAIDFTLDFDEDVTLTGSPTILLDLYSGTSLTGTRRTVQATAVGASGKTVTFRYTVQPGDEARSMAARGSTLVFPVGSGITDKWGNLASPSFSSRAFTNRIDTVPPTATGTIRLANAAASYSPGQTLVFDVPVSEPIFARGSTGTVTLDVLIGGERRTLWGANISNSGPNGNLRFYYLIRSTDRGNGLGIEIPANPLGLGGVVIVDGGGNQLTQQSFARNSLSGILINGT